MNRTVVSGVAAFALTIGAALAMTETTAEAGHCGGGLFARLHAAKSCGGGHLFNRGCGGGLFAICEQSMLRSIVHLHQHAVNQLQHLATSPNQLLVIRAAAL